MNTVLKIEYPETLPDQMGQTREEFERDARMALAVKLFETRRISSGVAASLVGMDRKAFLLALQSYGVAMIDLSEDELRSDIKNA